MNGTKTRLAGVDVCKCAAIVFVLLIHTSGDVLTVCAPGSKNFLEALFWSAPTRCAVPLFLLCSGALLLDERRELPLKKLWGRNILHLLLALFFWAAVYKVYACAVSGAWTAQTLKTAGKELLLWQHEAHLYFLPLILLTYALLPVTRAFLRRADDQAVRYALALWAFFGILLPTAKSFGLLDGFGALVRQMPLAMPWSAIGYTVLGDYLRRKPLPVKAAWACILLGTAICFGGTLALSLRAGSLQAQLLEGFSPGACLLAAGVFSLCMRVRLPDWASKAASVGSRASFCVYLVHILVLRILYRAGLTTGICRPLLSAPLLAALCGAGSFVIWLILSRIPWVRRWLI